METFTKKHQALILILVLLVIAGFAASYYFYSQYQKTQLLVTNPGLATQIQVKDVTSKVGALMVLPAGEQPTIATVSDITKLRGQAFFQSAQNGDKVLIYTKAKEAILYGVKQNKILAVAPININTPQAIRIAILNGSSTAGAETTLANDLKAKTNNVSIVKTDKASTQYPKTIVVDLSGNQANAASQLAQLVGGQVEQLPAGEQKPDADLLVIIGGTGTAAVPTTAPVVTTAPVISPTPGK